MNPSQKISFCVAALVSSLASPALVNAYEQRSGWSCYPDAASAANITYTLNGPTATGGAATLFCPIPDNSALGHNAVVTLTVHTIDGSNATEAVAVPCVSYAAAAGGFCGPGMGSGVVNVGPRVIAGGVPTWVAAPANDYAYFTVNLPAPGGAGPFALRGFNIQ